MSILIAVLIIAVIVVAAFWIIDNIGTPAPIGMILKAIVGLIALMSLLAKLGVSVV